MPMWDMRNVDPIDSLRAQQATAAVNGTGVDLQGYEAALCVASFGAVGGTTPSFTLTLQESNDDGGTDPYADVATADLDGDAQPAAVTTSNAAKVKLSYTGAKRYIRWIVKTVTGTSPTLFLCADIDRGHKRHQTK
jgi:hypothetical protein